MGWARFEKMARTRDYAPCVWLGDMAPRVVRWATRTPCAFASCIGLGHIAPRFALGWATGAPRLASGWVTWCLGHALG